MTTAIVIEQYGGPEVLVPQEVALSKPGAGQVRLRHTFIGVNFHDVYVRSGLYKTLSLPGTPGIEAVGIVEALGEGVEGFQPGDRVAYVTGTYGVYASSRLIDADLLCPIPDGISDEIAASTLLRGLTVEMLLYRVHQVQPGQTILVQAAAGGVGQLLCQWASHLGATVIGTVGSEEQVSLAKSAGCAHVIRNRVEDVASEVMAFTEGRGVAVAYDGVGQATFQGSLDALSLMGHLVNFGQASGAVPSFEVSRLAAKSNSLTRPIIFHYLKEKKQREAMTQQVFNALSQGWLKAAKPRAFALTDAAECHRVLEAQGASVPLLLVPSRSV